MSIGCKHSAAQAKSGYTRSICKNCPNKANILAKRAEIKSQRVASVAPVTISRHGW
jgi:hypothetical protein